MEVMCACGNYQPYRPEGICAPMQPIGTCLNCYGVQNLDFSKQEQTLFAGRTKGRMDALQSFRPKSMRIHLVVRPDQLITSSYLVGYLDYMLLGTITMCDQASDTCKDELNRAINRVRREAFKFDIGTDK